MHNIYFVKEKDNQKNLYGLNVMHIFAFTICMLLCLLVCYNGKPYEALNIVVVYVALAFFMCIMRRCIKVTGVYFEGDCIWYKYFIKRKILPEKIHGVKVIKDSALQTEQGFFGATYTVPRKDKNGNYIYCMIFLKKLYEDMRTYNTNQKLFCMEYHECIMFKTEYDLEAINRLRELNPDLVVMYEE